MKEDLMTAELLLRIYPNTPSAVTLEMESYRPKDVHVHLHAQPERQDKRRGVGQSGISRWTAKYGRQSQTESRGE